MSRRPLSSAPALPAANAAGAAHSTVAPTSSDREVDVRADDNTGQVPVNVTTLAALAATMHRRTDMWVVHDGQEFIATTHGGPLPVLHEYLQTSALMRFRHDEAVHVNDPDRDITLTFHPLTDAQTELLDAFWLHPGNDPQTFVPQVLAMTQAQCQLALQLLHAAQSAATAARADAAAAPQQVPAHDVLIATNTLTGVGNRRVQRALTIAAAGTALTEAAEQARSAA